MDPLRWISPAGIGVVGCVVLTLSVSACRDAEGMPTGVAVAPETYGAVLLARATPGVGPLLESLPGPPEEAVAEARLWWSSWALAAGEGSELRSRIYPRAAHLLYGELGEEGVVRLLEGYRSALQEAEVASARIRTPAFHDVLESAFRLEREAWDRLRKGEAEEALALGLQAADALRSISPAQVALELVTRASEAHRRIGEVHSYSELERTRIRRLTAGAWEALRAGDYAGAIRRAYYACQLLQADLY